MASTIESSHSYSLLHSDFMMVQLFQLDTVARQVTMATTEIIAKEKVQELYFTVSDFLELNTS